MLEGQSGNDSEKTLEKGEWDGDGMMAQVVRAGNKVHVQPKAQNVEGDHYLSFCLLLSSLVGV